MIEDAWLPIIWGAVRGVIEKRVNVDELVSLAIPASLLGGKVLTAAVVSCVRVLGSLIEEATAESACKASSLLWRSPLRQRRSSRTDKLR